MGCVVYNKTFNLCYLSKIKMIVPARGFLYVPHDFDAERDVFEPHARLKRIYPVPWPQSREKKLVPAAQIEIDKAYEAGEFKYAEDIEEPEPEPPAPEPEPEPEPEPPTEPESKPEETPTEDSGDSSESTTTPVTLSAQSKKRTTKKK